MENLQRIESLRQLKRFEKEEALMHYDDAVEQFETVAKQLYELLLKKETMMKQSDDLCGQVFSVQELQLRANHLDRLDEKITTYQMHVMEARSVLYEKKQTLLQKNIEEKQLEKLSYKKKTEWNQWLQKLEENQLNEISLQQFQQRKAR